MSDLEHQIYLLRLENKKLTEKLELICGKVSELEKFLGMGYHKGVKPPLPNKTDQEIAWLAWLMFRKGVNPHLLTKTGLCTYYHANQMKKLGLSAVYAYVASKGLVDLFNNGLSIGEVKRKKWGVDLEQLAELYRMVNIDVKN